jgi:peptidyl-prolyl cis-trans isomerase C
LDKIKPFLASLLKSPLLHFILIGAIAFVAYSHFKPPDRETIHITTQTIDALVRQQESITQHPVTPGQRQSIIESHIEDEVLLREAYQRGFDKNDYRVRKRLLQIMRTALSEVIPEPTVAQLRAYYEANRERYLTSPSRSFDHVYFSFSSNELPEDPQMFFQKLEGTADISKLGEYSLLGNRHIKSSFQTTAATFGKPFAQAVFALPVNRWQGPVKSFRGLHYVRVIGNHGPELPPFEQMESYLRTDYFMVKGRESQMRKIEELMKNYEIVVEGAGKEH